MTQPPRCPRCGRFCGVVYRWRGPNYTEVKSCVGCGLRPPHCSAEDGSVKGCSERSTHKGARADRLRDRYWCEDHAPEGADPLPYVEEVNAGAE